MKTFYPFGLRHCRHSAFKPPWVSTWSPKTTLKLLSIMFFLFFCYNQSYSQMSCTHSSESFSNSDNSCSDYPTTNLAKLDRSFGDEYVYIKVSGEACCGEILINPKSGPNCYYRTIEGPRGPGISFDELGTIPDTCDFSELENCSDGDPNNDQIVIECSDGQIGHRLTFVGTIEASDGSGSYWYYHIENKVNNCINGISHLTFALLDTTETCCEITAEGTANDYCTDDPANIGSIDVSTTLGLAPYSYTWTNNTNSTSGSGTSAVDDFTISGLSDGDYSITITDDEGCSFDITGTILTAYDPPIADPADPMVLCVLNIPAVYNLDLFDLLEPGYTVGGTWQDITRSATTSVQAVHTFTPGTYTFFYVVGPSDPMSVCEPVEAEVTITIDDYLEAGDDNTDEVCQDSDGATDYDLSSLLSADADVGGTWSVSTGDATIDATTGEATMNGDGDFQFTYTVPENGTCPEDQAEFIITVFPLTPTYEASITVCSGENYTFSYDSDGDGTDESYGPYTVGMIIVPVYDENGCPYDLKFTIVEYPETADINDSVTVCAGESYDWMGGTYTVGDSPVVLNLTDTNDCPYTATLTISEHPETADINDSVTVCAGESYDWMGGTYTVGDSPVVLNLTDTNDCPYTATLTISEHPETADINDSVTVCAGESYDWMGGTYTVGDSPVVLNLTDTNDCPYTATLTISEHPETADINDSVTVCAGESYDWMGGTYTVGDSPVVLNLTDTNDCPYTATLTISEYPETADINDSVTVCAGESYDWMGGTYTVGDSPVVLNLTDANDCPYTATLTISEHPETADINDSVTVCAGESYDWMGGTYTVGDSPVVLNLTDTNDCPYTATLTISEHPETADTNDSVTVCAGESYDWMGGTYTVGDSPVVLNLTDTNDCPYTATLTIDEYEDSSYTEEVTICEGEDYLWSETGMTYTAADSPVMVDGIDANDCPYTAKLTIYEYEESSYTEEVTICAGEDYLWAETGMTYTAADSPVMVDGIDANDCPYTATLTISEHPETADINDSVTVCAGESYDWMGGTYTVGDSPVVLNLTDTNDCPYTATLTISEYPETADINDSVTVCAGESYDWMGGTYTVGDSPVVLNLTDANDCPYTATLTISEHPETADINDSVTVCAGESYDWMGGTYTVGDSPVVLNLTDTNDCPYTATLTISEYPETADINDSVTVCAGESYDWMGGTYTVGDSPVVLNLTDTNDCPYTATLTISEYPETADTNDSVTVCAGESYDWMGGTYTVGDSPVVLNLTDTNDCPYTATLTIDEHPETADINDSVTVCAGESYDWMGGTYTVGDSPVVLNLTDTNDCPYTATLTISEYPETADTNDSVTVCAGESYDWMGGTYTVGDSPVVLNLTDTNDCPYTATLTISEYPETADTNDSVTVCAGESYDWMGGTYTVGDSPVVLNLTDTNDCPYTATLTIDEYEDSSYTEEVTICEGEDYLWSETGMTYTAADSPVMVDGIDANDCPYTAKLTIYEYEDSSYTEEVTICAGEDYLWAETGMTYTAADSPVMVDGIDANDCPYTATLIINVSPGPDCSITAEKVGAWIELTASAGASSYQWYLDGSPIDGATSSTYTAMQSGSYSVSVTDEFGCVESCGYDVGQDCGTSWAYLEGESLCFNEVECTNNPQWGFTTQIQPSDDPYEFILLEGAPGMCNNNGSTGQISASLTVTYTDGGIPGFDLNAGAYGHFIEEVHIWVGCTELPMKNRGKKGNRCTTAPGQFPCKYSEVNSDGLTVSYCESHCSDDDGSVWLAFHAVTCELILEGATANTANMYNGSSALNNKKPLSKNENLEVLITPNPTKNVGQIIISNVKSESNELNVIISNTTGQIINSFDEKDFQIDETGEYFREVDLNRYKSGIYVITARNGNRRGNTKLIVSD